MLLQLAAEVLSRFLRRRLAAKFARRELRAGWSALSGMASDRVCNRSGCLIAALKAATTIYNHLAFLDVSNIEHLWNGARCILETVKYMHPRHLRGSGAMLCNMPPHQTIAGTISNRGCGSE